MRIHDIWRLLGALMLAGMAAAASAATCNSTAGAGPFNWGTTGTWSCGHVPLNTDDVVIVNNSVVTVNIPGAVAGSLTITGGNTVSTLQIAAAANALSVTNAGGRTGNVTIGAPTANVAKQFTVGPGTLSVTGSVTISGGTGGGGAANISQLTATTGTITIGGDLNINAGSANTTVAQVTLTTGKITVTGDTTLTGGGANSRHALLSVTGAPAVGGNGININGALNVNATVSTSSTVSITAAGGVINVGGDVNNGDTITVGTGVFSATGAGATFSTTNTVIVTSTTVTSGTLAIAGNAAVTAGTTNPSGATMSVTTGVITVGGDLGITAGAVNNTDATVSVTSGRISVTGDTTVTGGTSNTRNGLLTVTAAPGVAGNGINLAGNLTVASTVAGSSTVSITAANGVINVSGTTGVNNGDTVTIGSGIFSVTNAGATYTNSSSTIGASTTVSTGTLSIAGNLTNSSTGTNTIADTITLSSTGVITVGGTLTNNTGTTSGTITTTTTGTINANGDFLNNGVFVHSAAGNLNLRGTNATMNGTFTRTLTTGIVTSNKTTAGTQNLSGTALSVSNFVMNSANSVTLGSNLTVNTTLTFTSGTITTGANSVIVAVAPATIATPSSSSYVVGNFQKNYAANASLNYFAGNGFPVGDASNFTPVNITAGTTTTAGSLAVSTTTAQHPQVATPIASTGIDVNHDIQRYWTFTATNMTSGATAIAATFTFVAGDVVSVGSPATTTANFIAERYDGTNWNATTLVAANATNTQVSNLYTVSAALPASNDIAIGDPLSGTNGLPGAFNIFETSTTAGSTLGRIYTKIVPLVSPPTITLDIVAVNTGRTGVNTGFTGAQSITITLLDSRDNTGALTAATNCRSSWTTIAGTTSTPTINFTAGRAANVTIATPANAGRDVRVRVTQAANTGCSTDRFTIRPAAFSGISSTNAGNSATSGGTTVKTGALFKLTATTSLAGYDNGSGNTLASPSLVPLIDTSQIIGSPTAGTLAGTFGTASGGSASGVNDATTGSFTYSEVGNFGLNSNLLTTATNAAIYDNVFTTVDQASGDCVAGSFSNALSGGKYGCNFGNAAIALGSGFGRFIPDHFNVSFNTPSFATACSSGTFTYVGQTFSYASTLNPVMTVTARSGSSNGLTDATTQNYAGVYANITNSTLTPNTQSARYTRFDALGGGNTPALNFTLGFPPTSSDPQISFTAGVGTLTFGTGTVGEGFFFTRSTTTPNAPFNADIALALNVIDSDGVVYASNPASFGAATVGNGIAFSTGKTMRFGRLNLLPATGAAFLPLAIPVRTEYWNGTGFVTNTSDSCTTLSQANIPLSAYQAPLAACNTRVSNGTGAAPPQTITFTSGVGKMQLDAPGVTKSGSVILTANLGNSALGSYCQTVGGGTTADSGAGLSYLQGAWNGSATYSQNPAARAGFGVYGTQPAPVIFYRENY